MAKSKTILKSLRMDIKLNDEINMLAEKSNRNWSNMVETLLIRAVRKYHIEL